LLIKYIKSVLWRVAKCLSYIEEARCLKVKVTAYFEPSGSTLPTANVNFYPHCIFWSNFRISGWLLRRTFVAFTAILFLPPVPGVSGRKQQGLHSLVKTLLLHHPAQLLRVISDCLCGSMHIKFNNSVNPEV